MSADAAQTITRKSNSNFTLSFFFLPKDKREAMNAVYAFCRTVDDIADSSLPLSEKKARLSAWRRELDACPSGSPSDPVAQALAQAVRRFGIPIEHPHEILAGVEMDLTQERYRTFEDLKVYCRRVASAVGWTCLPVFGLSLERHKTYAEELGLAFQLTNILRDVGADGKRKRIYLPQEDLIKYGYSENDLFQATRNDRFLALMDFEADRAENYFSSARSRLEPQDQKPLIAAVIMDKIYYALLQKLRENRYPVFGEKVRISKTQRLALALGTYLKSHFAVS